MEDVVKLKLEEERLGEVLAAILINYDDVDYVEGYVETVNLREELGFYLMKPKKFPFILKIMLPLYVNHLLLIHLILS